MVKKSRIKDGWHVLSYGGNYHDNYVIVLNVADGEIVGKISGYALSKEQYDSEWRYARQFPEEFFEDCIDNDIDKEDSEAVAEFYEDFINIRDNGERLPSGGDCELHVLDTATINKLSKLAGFDVFFFESDSRGFNSRNLADGILDGEYKAVNNALKDLVLKEAISCYKDEISHRRADDENKIEDDEPETLDSNHRNSHNETVKWRLGLGKRSSEPVKAPVRRPSYLKIVD